MGVEQGLQVEAGDVKAPMLHRVLGLVVELPFDVGEFDVDAFERRCLLSLLDFLLGVLGLDNLLVFLAGLLRLLVAQRDRRLGVGVGGRGGGRRLGGGSRGCVLGAGAERARQQQCHGETGGEGAAEVDEEREWTGKEEESWRSVSGVALRHSENSICRFY